MDEKQKKFMEEAIRLAIYNVTSHQGGPFGAVIVKDDKIIAGGANKVTATNDPTAHAEIVVIRQACQLLDCFDLSGCTIYSSCEPCPMCLGAIYWAHLDRIFYANTKNDAAAIGFDDSFIYEQLELAPNQRSIPMVQLKLDEGLKPFQVWKDSKEKIPY